MSWKKLHRVVFRKPISGWIYKESDVSLLKEKVQICVVGSEKGKKKVPNNGKDCYKNSRNNYA